MPRTIDFVVQVDVGIDESDFDSKGFIKNLKEFADRNLGSTSWEYKCLSKVNYPTEIKTVFCHSCEEEYTHISENGEDFKCLVCESKKIREVIHGTQPY